MAPWFLAGYGQKSRVSEILPWIVSGKENASYRRSIQGGDDKPQMLRNCESVAVSAGSCAMVLG
jgi:hypothetical protein